MNVLLHLTPRDSATQLKIATLLNDSDGSIASDATNLNYFDQSQGLVEALAKLTRDAAPEKRLKGCQAFRNVDLSAGSMLFDLMKDPDAEVRKCAVKKFSRSKDSAVHESILAMAAHDRDQVARFRALEALGECKGLAEKSRAALFEIAFKDSDPDIQEEAIGAMGLVKGYGEADQIRMIQMLREASKKMVPLILAALGEQRPSNPLVHEAMAKIVMKAKLNSFEHQWGARALGKCKNTSAKIQMALVAKLAPSELGDPAAQALHRLKPTDPEVRLAIMKVYPDFFASVDSQNTEQEDEER